MVRKLIYGATRGVVPGIEIAVADAFSSTQQLIDLQKGLISGRIYNRRGDPAQHPAETRIAELENSESALVFCSGMAAISTILSALVNNGQHVLILNEGNVTVRDYFVKVLPKSGIDVTFVPIDEMSNIRRYIQDNTSLIFLELPANPFLRIVDLASIVSIAKEKGLMTIVDSTFASPHNIKPLDYGADLVLHSATKYLGGHHDLSAGAIASKKDISLRINQYRNLLGTNLDPFDSFLLTRSLYTFKLTMNRRNSTAFEIARYLEEHPKVERVWYPGLESHPDYKLAKKQMKGFGGVVPFELRATEEETTRFVDALTVPYLAHNFGGCSSTIEQHVLFTHFGNRDEAERRGIKGNLLRFSVGFEETESIIKDFENAFKSLK
jgi:cystathionine beta-lyase/cystathionine gamma-synthase